MGDRHWFPLASPMTNARCPRPNSFSAMFVNPGRTPMEPSGPGLEIDQEAIDLGQCLTMMHKVDIQRQCHLEHVTVSAPKRLSTQRQTKLRFRPVWFMAL